MFIKENIYGPMMRILMNQGLCFIKKGKKLTRRATSFKNTVWVVCTV